MSYIDDFVATNAGRMTRDQITTSLRGAGYDDQEIRAALRRGPRTAVDAVPEAVTEPSWAEFEAETEADTAATEYIRLNASRYPREAVSAALIDAGYDRATIDAAWDRLTRKQDRVWSEPAAPASGSFWSSRRASAIAFGILAVAWIAATGGWVPEWVFTAAFLGTIGVFALGRMVSRWRR
jgi:hypothetical protein